MNRIPVELLSKILLLLPIKASDRLVCHAFNNILTPRTFRTFRTWDFTKDDFDKLVAISQSHLAKYVQEYEYKLTPFLPLPGIHEVDPMVGLDTTHDHESIDSIATSIVTQHEIRLHQTDILGTYYDILSLTKALPKFRNLKAVTVSRFDWSVNAPKAYETATTRAWWGVIKAVSKSEYPIEKLSLDSVYASMLASVPLIKMVQVMEVVGDLKKLEFPYISVSPDMEHGPANEVMLQVLKGAKNLESLKIGNGASGFVFGMWLVDRRYTQTFWPNLKVLELSARCSVRAHDLISFLNDHRKSLRCLTLKHFGLRRYANDMDPMVWDVVFEKLGAILELEKLSLFQLWGPSGMPEVVEDDLRKWEKRVPRAMKGSRS